MIIIIYLIAFLFLSADALERNDNVGRIPALGWNSWNAFACNIDATKIMNAANDMLKLGLKDVGYEYVNIDDCWSIRSTRNITTSRLIPDPSKFPDGISGLANQVHHLGLKIGIYSSAGLVTCQYYPASAGYEDIDAQAFAEWGIDYLKYDNCGVLTKWADKYNFCVPTSNNATQYPNGTCPYLENQAPVDYNWAESYTYIRFSRMRDALLDVNRTILYSLCEWGQADVNAWGNMTGNSWRTTGDIEASWESISAIANENSFFMNYVSFTGHPDPDMLEIGNGNLTEAESRSHFALWAIMKSPLIIGTDLSNISDANLAILKNKYLLAFNQDPVVGRSAHPYKWGYNPDWTSDPEHPAEYWSGPSSTLNGTLVLMLNSENATASRTAIWSEIPELKDHDAYQVIDGWSNKSLGCVKKEHEVSLTSHDVALLMVKEAC